MTDDFLSCPPPWKVFPDIPAEEFAHHTKQGAGEAYFDQIFRPFWSELSPAQRQRYLDRWCATAAWRDTLAFLLTPDPDIDLASEWAAFEAAERLRREQPLVRPPWWRRWFGGR
jgi:hypothetical protein